MGMAGFSGVSVAWASGARASPAECMINWLRKSVLAPYAISYSNQWVVVKDASLGRMKVLLGERLGAGVSGAAYSVVTIDSSGTVNFWSGMPLVMKIGHEYPIFGVTQVSIGPLRKLMDKEEADLRAGASWVLQAQEKGFLNRDTAWASGTVPALPILSALVLENGRTAFLKPYLKGTTLAELLEDPSVRFSPAMIRSLNEIYALNDAILRVSGRKITFDHNPTNLVWIEDPEQMRRFGLSRPSFFLFEFSLLRHSPLGRLNLADENTKRDEKAEPDLRYR